MKNIKNKIAAKNYKEVMISKWRNLELTGKFLINKNGVSNFVDRSIKGITRFGYRITVIIMMLSIYQFQASVVLADSQLVPGLNNTARSGFSGTKITPVGAASDHTAVTLINSKERNNVPCYLHITKHDINGSSTPGYTTWDECNGTSVEYKGIGFTLGTGLYVYGIQACTNNKNNQRVKGIRVFGGPIQDGVIQQIGLFDEFTRPNCSNWHSAVYCEPGEVATKVRIHHTGDEINGLSLACRVVADL